MPSFISYIAYYTRPVFLLLLAVQYGRAQPVPLKLESHKLRSADSVYHQGIRHKEPRLVAEGFYLFGKVYAGASDQLSAHSYFLKALRILEPLGDSYELARLYVRLADLAIVQGQYQETTQHAYAALAVAKRSKSDKAMIRACALLTRVHATNWSEISPFSLHWPKANQDSVLYYFRQVESLAYRLNDPVEVAHIKKDIGGQLLGKGDPQAINYLKDALKITIKYNSTDKIDMALGVASAYLHFGQPKRAWAYIQQAKQIGESEYPEAYDWKMSIENSLVQFYKKIGNWKQVALHNEIIHQWQKRDLLADREGAISKLHIEYQTEKKDLLLKAQQKQVYLQAENLRINQQIVVITIALLVLTAGASFVFFKLYRKNQQISILNAKLVHEQNHRVKNNLQVVSSLLSLQANRITDEKTLAAIEDTRSRIESMVILHRRLYEGDKLVRVNISEFIDEVTEIVLQAYGYVYIRVEFKLQTVDLLADDAMAIGLIVNELTTNACKHAFPLLADPAYFVGCEKQGNQIQLTVADNGPGFSMIESLPLKTSFGMTLVDALVDQLRGTYNFTNQNGTQFTLTFPFR